VCPWSDQPELLPTGQVVRSHDDFVADAEGDEDPLSIGGRCAGGITVFLVDWLQWSLHDGLLPEDLSAGAVEAKERSLLCGGQARDGAHAIAPDDRRGVPLAWDLGFPDRAGGIPVGRDVLLDAGPIAARAAPARPEFGFGRVCRVGEQDGEGKNSFHNIQDLLWGKCATDSKHHRSKDRLFNMLNPIRAIPLGSALCALRRAELPSQLSVLADLVVIPRIHTNDHAIGRFEVLKGELECLHDGLLVMTPSTRRQYLEA